MSPRFDDEELPVPVARPNGFKRLIGALFSPEETFQSIAERPDWAAPLVVFMIMALFAGIVTAKHVDFASESRAMLEKRHVPKDKIEDQLRLSHAIGKVASYCSPIGVTIVFLLIAAIMQLTFRLFGGEGGFAQYFSATLYSWWPRVIQNAIFAVVLLARGTVIGTESVNTLVHSNLGFLVDAHAHPFVFVFATSFDVFAIWSIILMSIGYAAVSRFSKARAAGVVLSLWGVVMLFKLGFAALRVMLMGGL